SGASELAGCEAGRGLRGVIAHAPSINIENETRSERTSLDIIQRTDNSLLNQIVKMNVFNQVQTFISRKRMQERANKGIFLTDGTLMFKFAFF
ncbi:MAG: hypothetical protein ABI254_11670, partial [Chthoniobacterales bacterium]